MNFIPLNFLPFQACPILAKLQRGKIPLLQFSPSFCFENEWRKKNVKENIPKKLLSFIHATASGVQKCLGGEKAHSRKPKVRKEKNQTQKELFVSEIKLEFWFLSTSIEE